MSNLNPNSKRQTFISDYLAWSDTGHAPTKFHLWACISAIAACLERKVWIAFDGGKWRCYPNLFIFCVANPGVGKSAAIDRVKNCLNDMTRLGLGHITMIPNTLSVSALIECMSNATQTKTVGTRVVCEQSAAYFVGGEGSESLSSIHVGGELTNCLTSLYDCQEFWERSTRAHGSETIRKGCFNMLMGTTFEFLSTLLGGSAIMGGFASRGTYVVFEDKFIRPSTGLRNGKIPEGMTESYTPAPKHILEGFARIHSMRGGFSCDDEFILAYEKWSPAAQEKRNLQTSEKMQALLVRQEALILKLAMVLSAAESSDMILKKHHWDGAVILAEECEASLPRLLRGIQSNPNSQRDLVQTIFSCFEGKDSSCLQATLGQTLLAKGFESYRYEQTLRSMISTKMLILEGANVRLAVDPNEYL